LHITEEIVFIIELHHGLLWTISTNKTTNFVMNTTHASNVDKAAAGKQTLFSKHLEIAANIIM
jgi:hypothetical protein